jgi:hypothetical protein
MHSHVRAIDSSHSGLYLIARQNYTSGTVLPAGQGRDLAHGIAPCPSRPGNTFRFTTCHAIMDSGYADNRDYDKLEDIGTNNGPKPIALGGYRMHGKMEICLLDMNAGQISLTWLTNRTFLQTFQNTALKSILLQIGPAFFMGSK